MGGGIRTVEDFRMILAAGADKVSVNSAAVKNPNIIKEASDEFGVQCVVVAVDAKARDDHSGWDVYVAGTRPFIFSKSGFITNFSLPEYLPVHRIP